MSRSALAGALLVASLAACDDAPPPRRTVAAPAPSAASQELLAQAMTRAAAAAERARELEARRPPPAPPPRPDDTAAALADRLASMDLDDSSAGVLGAGRDDMSAPLPDAPDGVLGGVPGTAIGDLLGPGTGAPLGGTFGSPLPSAPSDAISVVLLGDANDLDGLELRRHITRLRVRAQACRLRAASDGDLASTVTATITLRRSLDGDHDVGVHGAGPLADCLERLLARSDVAPGTSLTFRLTIPPT